MAERHKAQIYRCLIAVIAGSNLVEDMGVGLLCVAEVTASATTWGLFHLAIGVTSDTLTGEGATSDK